jgi:pimeloyl-ACP methyl ester carboxylesterase
MAGAARVRDEIFFGGRRLTLMHNAFRALFAVLSLPLSAARAEQPRIQSCSAPGLSAPARCGTLKVWEDRQARKGRKIGIQFLVVPATSGAPVKEAVAFFSGGPGQSAIDSAAQVTTMLAGVRDGRDLLFVDLRGTGRSNRLPCASAKPADLQSYLKEFYTPADVVRCAKELRSRADVRLYHSAPALDDVEELRAALGYEKLDLFGISYGTRAALVFLRRHPEHVRAVLMHGSAPTDTRYPITVPRDAQLAVDGVFAECALDPGCRSAFPDPAGDLKKSLELLERGPAKAAVLDPKTGAMTSVMLSRDRYSEGIRAMAYDASSSSLIPAVVHRAAQGDFGPAAEEEVSWRLGIEEQSRGVHLAVTCSEDVDFIDLAEADRIAQGTFMTAWRAADQKAACAVWPHAKLDASVQQPVRSRVPLLVMNGEHDPATARYHAERMLAGFPNGRLIVIPSQGHGFNGLVGLKPCYEQIVTRFIRAGEAKGVDASCMAGVHRPPFPASFPGGDSVVAMNPEALARFAGSYSGPEGATVVVREGRLHAIVAGEDTMLLPTGPGRFRVADSPHVRIIFREKDGAVVAFEMEEGGAPVETFTRKLQSTAPSRP